MLILTQSLRYRLQRFKVKAEEKEEPKALYADDEPEVIHPFATKLAPSSVSLIPSVLLCLECWSNLI